MSLAVIPTGHPRRDVVETGIRSVYLKEYGARPPSLPARLVAVLDADGNPQAATGLRLAEDGFFSECYLDQPVESRLAAMFARPVDREQVVEFASLAAMRPGAGMALVSGAVATCLSMGHRYAIFTATARLRLLLRRAGYPLVELGAAHRDRVEDPDSWGTYYLHDPRVVAVAAADLPAALARTVARPEAAHA